MIAKRVEAGMGEQSILVAHLSPLDRHIVTVSPFRPRAVVDGDILAAEHVGCEGRGAGRDARAAVGDNRLGQVDARSRE